LLSIVIDRLTKLWVHAHVPMGGGITVIPRVFRISNVINTGAAFSLFTDSLDPLKVRYALVAFSILAIVVVSTMLARAGRYFNSTSIGLHSSSPELSATSTTASSFTMSSTFLKSISSTTTGPTSTSQTPASASEHAC